MLSDEELCRIAARRAAPVFAAEGWVYANTASMRPWMIPSEVELFDVLMHLVAVVRDGRGPASTGRFTVSADQFGALTINFSVADAYSEGD
jgi:hypothetical protein